MIVSLVHDVCASIREIDRIDKIKGNMQSVDASYKELQAITEAINCLVAYTTVIGQKLPTSIQESIRQECESILSHIVSSRNNFDHDFCQTDALLSVKNSLQETIKKIEIQWLSYVDEQVREPLQLLDLVKYLPEVAAQANLYDALQEGLQRFTHEVPKYPEQLATFEQNVQELTHLLNSIQGLDVGVKDFLQKVIDGQATMKDLTADIHAWCQSGNREHIFRITIVR